jgi:hypothetical protein
MRSKITPLPVYVCRHCGLIMRSRGMGLFYLALAIPGVLLVVMAAYALAEGGLSVRFAWLGALGLGMMWFAARQFLEPTPRRDPSED